FFGKTLLTRLQTVRVPEMTGMLSSPQAAQAGDDEAIDNRPPVAGDPPAEFVGRDFESAGNSRVDNPIWRRAAAGIVERSTRVAATYRSPRRAFSYWVKAVRPHQWVKNLLVFLPLLTSHRIFEAPLLAL